MKPRLMTFVAVAAFTLPLVAAPVAALAQERGGRGERGGEDLAQAPQRDRGRPGGGAAEAPDTPRSQGSRPDRDWSPPSNEGPRERPTESRPPVQDRPNGGQNGGGQRPGGDNRPDRPAGGWNNGGGNNGGQNNGGGQRPGGESRPDRPTGGWNNGGGANGGQRPDQNRPDQNRPGQNRPDQNRPDRPGGGWNNNDPRPGNDRPGNDRPGNDRPGANRPDRPGGSWNNNGPRPGNWDRDRDRQRQEYRNRFDSNRWSQNWNRRQRSDWWRNDRRFSGWSGVRIGFYFAPGYGYYSVPRNYYGQRWYEGQYLPSIFWRYQMNDYRTYGLGYPPPGTRWVYVDNSIYLIDEYDGYIIDVVRDFWRW